jgi:hypothetical protein
MKTYNNNKLYNGSEALSLILNEKHKLIDKYSAEDNLRLCNAIRICLGKELLSAETWDARLYTDFVTNEFNNIPQNDVY